MSINARINKYNQRFNKSRNKIHKIIKIIKYIFDYSYVYNKLKLINYKLK